MTSPDQSVIEWNELGRLEMIVKYPFPLTQTELAYLELPRRGLTKGEAIRLSKMIWTLVEEATPSSSSQPPAQLVKP